MFSLSNELSGMFTRKMAGVKRETAMRGYLTIGETAKRLNLEVDTLRKLERAGKIRAVRTKGGHRRFTEEEIDRFRRSRRKNRGTKPKRRGAASRSQRARPATRHHPASGEFVANSFESAGDLDDLDEDLPVEELDEDEEEFYAPPPPPPPQPRAVPAPQVPAPRPAMFAPRPAAALASVVDTGLSDRLRLQTIKNYGRSTVPWGVPAEWEGKVIADLERFVTPIQFPPDLSFSKAVDIVRARVTEVLGPYHTAGEKAKRDKKAKEDSDRRRAALIAHGNEYARRETSDWDWSASTDARAEVEKVLNREVEHDWTEHEIENAADQVLDEWDEDEHEECDEE
jgi:excisionase family DNA binding protein